MRRRIFATGLCIVLCIAMFVGAAVVTSPNISSLIVRNVGTYITSADDEKTVTEVDAMAKVVASEVEAEGAVLLSNNGTLPFDSSISKVNVFGWASIDWQGGGSGSGGIKNTNTDLLGALKDAGIETNAELSSMYESFQKAGSRPRTLASKPEESSVLYEPSISDEDYYTEDILKNAKDFSDTAIVVIGRFAGESSDMPLSQYKVSEKGGKVKQDKTRTSLDFSTEEEALLAYVGANYEHVCVVINAANTMALGALETTKGIDAVLWVGYTGQYAADAIPNILWGKTNPSGRTVDTFAYDFATNPSYASSSEHVGTYTGAEGLYPADGTTSANDGVGEAYDQVSYIDYSEGIYLGYRWYETADTEGYWASVNNEYGQGYAGVVQYPFGYGLSYTSFEWEVIDAPSDGASLNDSTSVTVHVTNTGNVAGKDVVQLYYTAPYTKGGIEKSSCVLGAYAKTKELAPGESQDVTLTLDTRDMASYDYLDANHNGFAGYELDAGTYVLSLRHNAYEVDDAAGAQISLNLPYSSQYPTDETTGAEVSNKFTGDNTPAGVSVDGTNTGQNITYLSRADFAGTFPAQASTRAMPEVVAKYNLFSSDDAKKLWEALDELGDVSMPTTGAKNGLVIEEDGNITALGRTLGADYNAEEWESLLDELTLSEMEYLVTNAYSGTAALPSVGKNYDAKDADGPSQIGGFLGFNYGVGFPCSTVLAQTWNTELANKEGLLIGAQAAARGYSGWYAPATNLHRSPFGGRNYEYYSEDVLLSGTMCGNVVAGARNAGVYCYVKHLVVNETEVDQYRDGVYVWLTEQALRELYLEPFRTIIENYHATGLMSSYCRLGAVWTGGNSSLLTEIVRLEWGFEGTIITDYSDHPAYMNGSQALACGGDLWMQFLGAKFDSFPESPSYVLALRSATKDVLYTYLDARVANEAYVEETGNTWAERPETSSLFMRLPSIIGWVLRIAGAGLALLSIWRISKARKRKKVQER